MNGLPPLSPTRKWAHDIRNAFNCIRLCTAAMDVCPEPDEKVEMLEEIITAADRAVALIDVAPEMIEEATLPAVSKAQTAAVKLCPAIAISRT